MTITEPWNAYSDGDYLTSFRLSVEQIASAAGLDLMHIAGLSLMKLRRFDEGLALLKAAITLRPQSSHLYTNAAFIAEQEGLTQDAAFFAKAGLADFPEDTDLLLLQANSLVIQLRFDEALTAYHDILERDPNHVQSMINMGNICRAKDDFPQATKWLDRAESVDPDYRDLIFARATMHTQMGEDDKAIRILERFAADVDAQFLLSLLYLARGDYERGFRLYRARSHTTWYRTGNFVHPLAPFDHWTEAVDQSIAVIQEGGLGDLIQFVRYIPSLAEVAKEIVLYVPPSMFRLFAHLPSNVVLQSSEEIYETSAHNYVTTDVEMAYHFRTTLDTIPNKIPYLSVPSDVILQHRLPETKAFRVGLCWSGGSRDSLNQRSYDYRRSFDLDTYLPLADIPGVEFVSLQMGQRSEQTCLELPMSYPLDSSFDFLDTAAVIMQLDLVISVDTSVVHLAAALGKPVWLLSRYDSCWRWLHNRSDSPWYPGVLRVFGQKRYRDWSQPIAEVTQALRDLVKVHE